MRARVNPARRNSTHARPNPKLKNVAAGAVAGIRRAASFLRESGFTGCSGRAAFACESSATTVRIGVNEGPRFCHKRGKSERAMTMQKVTEEKRRIAELTARMLLEINAVRFYQDKPFIFTSGLASPVYTDCRRIISFPRVRSTLIDFGVATIQREVGFERFDAVAGGETAGIAFAAWMAERMMLPMQYVRKKPKGFGRNAQIEGEVREGQNVLLVEDMTTDGGSKVAFIDALRKAGCIAEHAFAFFYYDIFPKGLKTLSDMGVTHHALATWWDVLSVAKESGAFDAAKLAEVETFMHDPAGWSVTHGGTTGAAA